MTKQIKIMIMLSCILFLGCKKDIITSIEIYTQADVDYYCDNLTDSDTFEGAIVISTEEELNYKCLDRLRHIKGTLILSGPGTTVPFRNIETVVEGEGFIICDEAVDTMAFPNLRTIGSGLNIGSFCNFSNVLYMPDVEILTALTIASPSSNIERSGTIIGFDKLEEINNIYIDTENGLLDNLTIDGFRSLEKILGKFTYNRFTKEIKISAESFNNLEEIGQFWFAQHYESIPDFSLEYIFPSLNKCDEMTLINFDNKAACYLTEHVASGDIKINVQNLISGEYFVDEALLDLCE